MNVEIILLLVLILLSAFFSGVETAMISLPKSKVRSSLDQNRAGSASLERIKNNPSRLLITLLIGNNLVNIAAASVATAVAIKIFGESGVGIATGIMTFLILVFCDIIPKSVAISNAEKVALITAKPVEILQTLLLPLVKLFEILTDAINKISGEKNQDITVEDLRATITLGLEEGLLDKEASERLYSVLDFESTLVKDIMTRWEKVIAFDAELTVQKFLDHQLDSPYDRYPLYENSRENVVGFLDVIDVVRAIKEGNEKVKLLSLMRPTVFVNESTSLDQILTSYKKKTSLGMVVDDKGEITGIFSSQDIVEELVGDIFEKEIYKSRNKTN